MMVFTPGPPNVLKSRLEIVQEIELAGKLAA